MKNILKAWLKKNKITSDPNDYTAIVSGNGSIGIEDIIDDIVKDGIEINRDTIRNVVNRFNDKAADLVVSGYKVNTGLAYMRPVIRGVFYNKIWDSTKHSIYINIKQGAELAEAIADTTVEILGEQPDPIEILSITDQTTGKTDGTLTKGRNVELKGSYLKVVGDNADCGISFENISTQEVTKLATTDIVINEPSRLLIFVPATLAAGEYELIVTTQYCGGGKLLKEPRSTTLDLSVVIS